MRRVATVLAAAAFLMILACMAGPAPADTLTLKDGRKLEGKLLSRGDDQIAFQVIQGGSSTVMTFRAAEANLKDTAAVAAQFPQLTGDPQTVKELFGKYEKQIEIIRRRIVAGTFRKGVGNE